MLLLVHSRLRAGLGSVGTTMLACTILAAATALPVAAQRTPAGLPSVSELAESLTDSVVNISTTQIAKGPEGVPLPKVPKGSPFEDLFEDFFNKRGGQSQSERKVSSLGSGFVIDGTEGLIVTNNHVIDGADEIYVNFHDGSKLKVDKVLGTDTKTDLALLKVTPKTPLKAVPLGSSDTLKVGDWVMAIGNPFGLGGSVTVGIISAKQRDINAGPYDEFLQTDAAINKGNSGGPLFNMSGEVIGVNTAIISPTGGSIGIGFAIPSDTVTSIVSQLKQFGQARRGWLGVQIQTINDDIAERLDVEANVGALVSAVTADSPASKGGLQQGDIIMKFDGKAVTAMRGLPRLVAQTAVGKTIDIEVKRKGEMKTLQVAIGQLDEEDLAKTEDKPAVAAPKDAPAGEARKPDSKRNDDGSLATSSVLGLKIAPVTEDVREQFGLRPEAKGLVVTEADAKSVAVEKGVRVGDVIVEAQEMQVRTASDLAERIESIKKAGGNTVLLLVEDAKGEVRTISVPFDRP
jgi:serine protease Do